MEEFNGLKVPRPPTATIANYKGFGCAVGCEGLKDWEACCPGITCDECIYHACNRKTLEAYLERQKMITQYRGCNIPSGLTKDNAHILEVDSACCATAGKLNVVAQEFCTGIRCAECICYSAHRKELKELLKMWKEEDNPIKPGMVVKYGKDAWCLVYKVEADRILGWIVGDNTTEAGSKLCELGNYVTVPLSGVVKVYEFKADTMPHGEAIYSLVGNYTGWRRFWRDVELPVLELTVKDIEKKYGRKVKIVRES